MSDVAIRVENLSKLYRIGATQERHDTLRDAVTGLFRRRSSPPALRSSATDLWALKDVSFEVKQGEVVGIIGRNGAGKSTLLKILSRITEPTTGRVTLYGRVASLLEVGTGFHPELTGRENIYLNGAILGMKRREIDRKFDDIVAFAEVERFLDTPVKRYSSGMYVRLAFAVAAYLEPEILLVDEVLAVGDAAFQKKCLGKMSDVAKAGRTVLFVSHNMGAIVQLCPSAILLQHGNGLTRGESDAVIRAYLHQDSARSPGISLPPTGNPESPVILTGCWLSDESGNYIDTVDTEQEFLIVLRVLIRAQVDGFEVGVRVQNGLGQPLFTSTSSNEVSLSTLPAPGEYVLETRVRSHFLAPDAYSLTVFIHRPYVTIFDLHEQITYFHVIEAGSLMWQYSGQPYGNIVVQLPWTLRGREQAQPTQTHVPKHVSL